MTVIENLNVDKTITAKNLDSDKIDVKKNSKK